MPSTSRPSTGSARWVALACGVVLILLVAGTAVWLAWPLEVDAGVPLSTAPRSTPTSAPVPRSGQVTVDDKAAGRPQTIAPPAPSLPAVEASAQAEPWSLEGWPDGMPAHLRPPEFDVRVRQVVADCKPRHLSLVTTDCSRPPCYAVFRVERGDDRAATGDNKVLRAFASECEPWRELYGSTMDRFTRGSFAVECEDGTEEWLLLVGSERAFAPLGVDRAERFEILKVQQGERLLEVYDHGVNCPP